MSEVTWGRWNIALLTTIEETEFDFFENQFFSIRIQIVADTAQPTAPIESPATQLSKNI